MPRRKATRFYFEPWLAAKSQAHGKQPFADGVPEGYPEGVAEPLIEAWQRADDNADWVLWGSRMAEPEVVKSLCGKVQVMDDRRIIGIRRALGLPEGSPTNKEIAERIAECVNALAGVGDPAAFMEDVRALLLAYVQGDYDDPHTDTRFLSLMTRCIPPEQQESFKHAKEVFG